MTVSSTTPTTATLGIPAANASTSVPSLSADFNMFLKLLTTQMQNQDPLAPMDSSQYTQQLAQYSQVEQTIQQTATLKEILGQLGAQNMAQSASFIGREAQFDSDVSGLAGATPASWNFTAARPVVSLIATITNANGDLVDTRTIDAADTGRFDWNGQLTGGGIATDGLYRVSIAGLDANGDQVPVAVNSIGLVKEVMAEAGSVTLGVNGIQFPASTLLSIKQAGA